MIEASNNLEFEKAAMLRDQIKELKNRIGGSSGGASAGPTKSTSYGKGGRKKFGKR